MKEELKMVDKMVQIKIKINKMGNRVDASIVLILTKHLLLILFDE